MRSRTAWLAAASALLVPVTQAEFSWKTDLYSANPPSDVYDFLIDPVRPNILLAAVDQQPAIVELDLNNPVGWGPTLGGYDFTDTVYSLAALGDVVFASMNAYNTRYLLRRAPNGTWAPVAEGLDNNADQMKACPDIHGNMKLYAAGSFSSTSSGSVTLNGIGEYDDATGTWTAFDAGLNGYGRSLECGPDPGTLFVGG